MNLFGVGAAEAALVFVIALIVVGPHRFPEVMRNAGRWYRMARAYSNEVMKDVRAAVDDIEREVKAETDDFQNVRELTDITRELRDARTAVEDAHRETREVLTEDERSARAADQAAPGASPQAGSAHKATSDRPTPAAIRPSQRSTNPADAFKEIRERGRSGASASSTSPATDAPAPTSTTPKTADGDTPPATFDPFAQRQTRQGPVHIRQDAPADTEGAAAEEAVSEGAPAHEAESKGDERA